ncbi:MAG TPA: hypothetical protein VKR24_02490 [Candidatus Limnocylindrales bacterium]|nr:hypothetical protein [Candidatus Limnocylindrales bacterium]
MPLVRGPFGSLTAAKAAIDGARGAEPAVSPLAGKVAEHTDRDRPPAVPTRGGRPYLRRSSAPAPTVAPARSSAKQSQPAPAEPAQTEPAPPPEPKWLRDLKPAERRRAHELIDRLGAAGVPNPESLVGREITGNVPAVATFAVARAVKDLGAGAAPEVVAKLLAEGADAELGVTWRLVDGEGRPIKLGSDPTDHPTTHTEVEGKQK